MPDKQPVRCKLCGIPLTGLKWESGGGYKCDLCVGFIPQELTSVLKEKENRNG